MLCSSEVEHLIPRGMNDKLRAQQWMILIQDHYRSCVSFSPHQARRKFLGKNFAQSVPLIDAPVNTRVRPRPGSSCIVIIVKGLGLTPTLCR